MEICCIGITVVDIKNTFEENIPSVEFPVTEGRLYDEKVWVVDGINPRKVANHHCSGLKLPGVRTCIFNNLTLLD